MKQKGEEEDEKTISSIINGGGIICDGIADI